MTLIFDKNNLIGFVLVLFALIIFYNYYYSSESFKAPTCTCDIPICPQGYSIKTTSNTGDAYISVGNTKYTCTKSNNPTKKPTIKRYENIPCPC